MSRIDRALAGDMAAAVFRHLASAASGIVTVAVVARALGADRLGAWTLIGTSAYLVGLADLGTSTVVQRVAVRGDDARTRALFGFSLGVVCTVAPALAAAAFFVLGRTVSGSGLDAREVSRSAAIALAGGLAGAISYPLRAVLLVRNGVRESSLARAVGAALQVTSTVLLLRAWGTLLAPSLALAIALVVETAMLVRSVRRRAPSVARGPTVVLPPTELRGVARSALAPLAINAAVALAQRLDVFVLAAVAPLRVVAAYGVALRACDQALLLAKQTSSALLGRFGDPRARAASVRVGSAVLGSLGSAGLAALAVLGVPILTRWAGPVMGEGEVVLVLELLACAGVLSSWTEIPCSALAVAAPSPWAAARPVLAGCALNVAITLSAAHAGGAAVIALATLLGNALALVLVWRGAAVMLRWRATEVLDALAPGAASAIATTVAALAIRGGNAGAVAATIACAVAALTGATSGALVARASLRRAHAS